MRSLWVGLVIVALLGGPAVCNELSGRFSSFVEFVKGASLIDNVSVHGEIAYAPSDWTFTLSVEFVEDAFSQVSLDAEGTIGAFDLFTIVGLKPDQPLADFDAHWNTVATLSLGGAHLYAITAVSTTEFFASSKGGFWESNGDIGIGARLGGWGTFGEMVVYAETCLNMDYSYLPSPFYYWMYGFDAFVSEFRGVVVDKDYYDWHNWYLQDSWLRPQSPTCTLPWSRTDILLFGPFGCLDLGVFAALDCGDGFDTLAVFAEHVDLGLDWLEIGRFLINWEIAWKGVSVDLTLVWDDAVCVRPYFAIAGDPGPSLDGIALEALTLEYEIAPGVVLKAGEKFATGQWHHYASWGEQSWSGWTSWGDIAPWHANHRDYSWQRTWNDDYDEYVALLLTGDACCGGALDAFVYNWFDTDQTDAFMDWAESVIGIRTGIGTNTTLMLNVFLDNGGLHELEVGVDFVW